MRRVTIREVARKAGVSAATVSRVLAGDPRISTATRERVRQAMRELRYTPNAAARSLATRRSQTVGLIFPQAADVALANPFFPEFLRGIGSVLAGRGYHMLLTTAPDSGGDEAAPLRLVRAGRVDGLILLGPHLQEPLIEELMREGYPFVLIGRPADPPREPVALVNNDNVDLAWRATLHLIEHGHRCIAFINGPEDMTVSIDRLKGYRRALQAAGIADDPDRVVFTDFSLEQGYDATVQLLDRVAPTAIFAADDHLAMGAYRALHERGMVVGRDVSVLAVNDTPAARLAHPPLSVMRIPIFDMGVEAATMLLELIGRNARPRQIIVPAEFVERSSCGSPPRRAASRHEGPNAVVRSGVPGAEA